MSDLQTRHDEMHAHMLDRRDIYPEDACTQCGGYGVRMYSSTATWHGGVGGQACTAGVCDRCWGSGSETRTWLNLRTRRDEFEAAVKKAALTYVADMCMAKYSSMLSARMEMVRELEAMLVKRKTRPEFFEGLCRSMIKVLSP